MGSCLILINTLSGGSNGANAEKLKAVFGRNHKTEFMYIDESSVVDGIADYDRIVVCGGDGTLNTVINRKRKEGSELIYCPYGTMNEFASGNSKEKDFLLHDIGRANESYFAYVLACGSFTPLGYIVKNKYKKMFRSLAYMAKVFDQYKVFDIKAELDADGEKIKDNFTLILVIDSPRCFGFNFNKMYSYDDGLLHLLAVKAPKSKGFAGKVRIFFPLFRAFFIGFKKEYRSKNILFRPIRHLNVRLSENTDFCVDGEKVTLNGELDIEAIQFTPPVQVYSRQTVDRLYSDRDSE